MINKLIDQLNLSTCNFTAVKAMKQELERNGFTRLSQDEPWDLWPGRKYYVESNDSSLFAFVIGMWEMWERGYRIIAAHSDSPALKIKPNSEIYCEGGTAKLNVEKYGGPILYTWFDRPLSIAGRVMVKGENPFFPKSMVVDLKVPVATIPHLAIHFNRNVNEGNPLSVQKDMLPVIGQFTPEEWAIVESRGGAVKCMVAETLEIEPEEILDYELFLYPCEKAGIVGARNEYLQAGRIDDLSMAWAAIQALIDESDNKPEVTRMVAIFDNEETGSGTRQGAHSPVLKNILSRLTFLGGGTEEDFHRSMALSFLISADDAHGWHPNYGEKYDPTNHPVLGGGPVVKINANCKYMTDAESAAVIRQVAEEAGVECQYFVNHSDIAGGSTLGNILTSQLDIRGVDLGNAIWAMHSARETASVADQEAMTKLFRTFFSIDK